MGWPEVRNLWSHWLAELEDRVPGQPQPLESERNSWKGESQRGIPKSAYEFCLTLVHHRILCAEQTASSPAKPTKTALRFELPPTAGKTGFTRFQPT